MWAGPVTTGLLTKRRSSVASSTTSTSARWMVWLQNDSSRESGGQKPTLALTHCRSRSISEIYAPLTPKISTAKRVMASKYSDVELSRMPSFSSAATRLRSSSGSIHSVVCVSIAALPLRRQQPAQRRGGAAAQLAVADALGLEDADGMVQVARLVLQDLHRRGGLLDQRRVLLRDLVHQRDGAVDFLDADALFVAGGADGADHARHLLHAGDDVAHGGAGRLDQLGADVDLADRLVDQRLDFARRRRAALGQVAHLGGDHGEAPALLARAGRLDGRVQGQDIGLESDAVDHADDLDDLARRHVDRAHGVDHVADDLAALAGDEAGVARHFIGLLGAVGVLLDGGGQLFHRRGGLFQRAGLVLGATRQVFVTLGNLGADGGHRVGRTVYFGHRLAQVVAHLHQHGHDAVVVATPQFDVVIQLATVDGGGQRLHFGRLGAQSAAQVTGDEQRHGDDHAHRDHHQHHHQFLEVVCHLARHDGFGFAHFLLLVDEFIDRAQPADEGRLALRQQQLARAVHVAALAQFDDFFNQRHGALLAGLDVGQLGFFRRRQHRNVLGEDGVERLGRGLVVAVELVDQAAHLGDVGVLHQRHVTHGDGAVVHAAAEVDREPLLDVVDVADAHQAALDGVHLDDAEDGQDQHHGQNNGKAGVESGGDADFLLAIHGNSLVSIFRMLNLGSTFTKYINYIRMIVYTYTRSACPAWRHTPRVSHFSSGMWQIIHAFMSEKQNWRSAYWFKPQRPARKK